MNNSLKLIFSLSVSLLISIHLLSCSTLNKAECNNANWNVLGFEDGNKGRELSYIKNHKNSCAEYSISPDLSEYLIGHAAGMRQFCTENNGYKQGLYALKVKNICPPNLKNSFQRGYSRGLKTYKIQSEMVFLQRNIDNNTYRLQEIEGLIEEKNIEIPKRVASESKRSYLLKEIKDLHQESKLLQIKLNKTRATLEQLKGNIQNISYSLL